jgi:hypothetical protein
MENQTVEPYNPTSKPVRINGWFHKKLETMSEERHLNMGTIVELLIDAEWERTRPVPEPTVEQDIERRK